MGRACLLTDTAGVTIHLQKGEVIVAEATAAAEEIRLPDKRMAQLLSGFRSEQTTGHRLLEILFPAADPYWYVDDI